MTGVDEMENATDDDNGRGDCIYSAVLSYLIMSMRSTPLNERRRIALTHFTGDQILEAKNALWSLIDQPSAAIIGNNQVRRGSHLKSKKDFDIDDVLEALDKLDSNKCVPDVAVRAAELHLIPQVSQAPSSEQDESMMHRRLDQLEAIIREMGQQLAEVKQLVTPRSLYSSVVTNNEQPVVDAPTRSSETASPVLRQTQQQIQSPHYRRHTSPEEDHDVAGGSSTENGAEWREQKNRKQRRNAKRKNKIGRFGAGKAEHLKAAPMPDRHLFLGRLETGDEASIKRHVEDRRPAVNLLEVKRISHEEARFKSFKISCPANQFHMLDDASLWPENSIFYPFREYKSKEKRPNEKRPGGDTSSSDYDG